MGNPVFCKNQKEQNKKTELDDIPSEWHSLELQEIAEEIYRYPTYYNIKYTENGVPEVRGELINENGTLEKDKANNVFISWIDIDKNTGQKQVLFRASNDNGQTFGNPVTVSSNTTSAGAG